MSKIGKVSIKNPFLVFFLLVASSSQGLLIQYSVYLFETVHFSILTYMIVFSPLIITFLIGFLFGLNTKEKFISNFLLINVIVQFVTIGLLLVFEFSTIDILLVLLSIFSFFSGFVSLYCLDRCLYSIREEENRVRQLSWLIALWFGGQALFGLLFVVNPSFALGYSVLANLIGLFGLKGLLDAEKGDTTIFYDNFKLSDVYSPNLISLLILFTTYTFILFSFVTLFASSTYLGQVHYSGKVSLSIFVGIIATTLISIVIGIINRKLSLRATFQVVYLVISLATVFYLFNNEFILVGYFVGITIWAVFGIFVLNFLVDMYPKPKYLRIVSIWWLTLSLGFGGGILAPFIINNTTYLLYMEILGIFLTILFLNLLSTSTVPLMVYEIAIFTPVGTPIYTKGYSDLDNSLLSGLLSGIMSMFKEVFKSGSELRYIDHGDKKLIIRKSNLLIGVLLISHVEDRAVDQLRDILSLFEAVFHKELVEEPYHISLFSDLPQVLTEKIDSLNL